jgi:hypothetical protein
MIGVSVIVAALGIGAGSTSTDQAKEHLASVVTAEKSENAVLKREVKRLRRSNHDWHRYARKVEREKGQLLSLVAALRRKLHPPAPECCDPDPHPLQACSRSSSRRLGGGLLVRLEASLHLLQGAGEEAG